MLSRSRWWASLNKAARRGRFPRPIRTLWPFVPVFHIKGERSFLQPRIGPAPWFAPTERLSARFSAKDGCLVVFWRLARFCARCFSQRYEPIADTIRGATPVNYFATAIRDFFLAFIGATIIVMVGAGFWFLVSDAPSQINIRDRRIVELGGAPDAPIIVPPLSTSERTELLSVLSDISDELKNEVASAVNDAENIEDNNGYEGVSRQLQNDRFLSKSASVSMKFDVGTLGIPINIRSTVVLSLYNEIVTKR